MAINKRHNYFPPTKWLFLNSLSATFYFRSLIIYDLVAIVVVYDDDDDDDDFHKTHKNLQNGNEHSLRGIKNGNSYNKNYYKYSFTRTFIRFCMNIKEL